MMDENINVHLAEKFCDGMIFIKMGWSTREKYVVMQTVKSRIFRRNRTKIGKK